MLILKKLFKKLGYLVFFLNVYFAYAQMDKVVIKNDPALDAIVEEGADVEKLADGFIFTEGPIWNKKEGYLLFCDVPADIIYKWTPDGSVEEFKKPSGRADGLNYDSKGNLIICEDKGRRLSRLSPKGEYSVITDNYKGKKFNSVNDIAIANDGSLYFTDPPYGLKNRDNDSLKELKQNGVYRFHKGKTELLVEELNRPNGLAFSIDQKLLYVANSENPPKYIKYEVKKDGSLNKGMLLFDASSINEKGGPDGMKVDLKGNIYATGPGGILIISPSGKHLGTIKFPEQPSNCAFGDVDMKTLYVTARKGLYRVKLKTAGRN